MSVEFDIANPGATELFESLRAFGYDLPTAIADVIDNSITAEARNIWIDLHWDGPASRITVRDDGKGMTEAQLVEAMRPGSSSPVADREKNDLGRFGLGMKTASISQCRCLTVLTKMKGGSPAVRRWDLDYLASLETKEWRLLKGDGLLTAEDIAPLDGQASGTTLFWDRLDTLVGNAEADDEVAQKHFRERAELLRDHLAMVFHRFLKGRGAITIHINGRSVAPWDPFMEHHDAVERLSDEPFGDVKVKAHILPHHSRISTEEHSAAAGPNGWNAHQGFYIYRNRRLLVAGDWLELGMQKEEHFKLARIRIDLPNSEDLAWQIDVKKSRARPPASFRRDLKRIAKVARARASEIYRHRGKLLQRKVTDERAFLWKHMTKHGKTFYKINRDHPLVSQVIESSDDRAALKALLSLIEQTVPAPLIAINNAESPDSFGAPFEDSRSDLRKAMSAVFEAMVDGGAKRSDAARALLGMEPFNQYPDLVAGFIEEVAKG